MAVKIGFIGAGRMAGAMIKGLIAKNVYGPEEIVACAPTKETRDRMTQETGIRMFDKASDIAGLTDRSEERRVGKGCGSRWSPCH